MKKIILVFLVFITVLSCKKKDKNDPSTLFNSYDRKAMLSNISNNVILPAYQNFSSSSDSLTAACTRFINQPNDSNLTVAQAACKKNASAWAQAEIYNFGPEDNMLLKQPINTWPVDTAGIENAINTNAAVNATYVNSKATNVRGIKAIEYLLFHPNTNIAIISRFSTGTLAANRKNYLVALCQNLQDESAALYNAWKTGYAQTFSNADGNDVSSSIGLLVNQMVYLADEIKNMKLDSNATQATESPYSQTSLNSIKDNLTALQNTFMGRSLPGNDGQGLDDLLNYLKAQYNGGNLSDAIKTKFATAVSKVNAINTPLETAIVNNPQQVKDAHAAMKDLLVIMKVDMVNNLGVLLTFTDNDGD